MKLNIKKTMKTYDFFLLDLIHILAVLAKDDLGHQVSIRKFSSIQLKQSRMSTLTILHNIIFIIAIYFCFFAQIQIQGCVWGYVLFICLVRYMSHSQSERTIARPKKKKKLRKMSEKYYNLMPQNK